LLAVVLGIALGTTKLPKALRAPATLIVLGITGGILVLLGLALHSPAPLPDLPRTQVSAPDAAEQIVAFVTDERNVVRKTVQGLPPDEAEQVFARMAAIEPLAQADLDSILVSQGITPTGVITAPVELLRHIYVTRDYTVEAFGSRQYLGETGVGGFSLVRYELPARRLKDGDELLLPSQPVTVIVRQVEAPGGQLRPGWVVAALIYE
jgi:hypothetical protein